MRDDSLLAGAVGGHLLLSTAHGGVHGLVPVPIPAWQLVVVVVTMFVFPLVGLALFARGLAVTGAYLVLGSSLGGFAFEAVAHFVVVNPDHVSQTGSVAFAPTALGSTLGTGLAAVAAAWVLRSQDQRSASSAIESST